VRPDERERRGVKFPNVGTHQSTLTRLTRFV
jgi:hypothetical protein